VKEEGASDAGKHKKDSNLIYKAAIPKYASPSPISYMVKPNLGFIIVYTVMKTQLHFLFIKPQYCRC